MAVLGNYLMGGSPHIGAFPWVQDQPQVGQFNPYEPWQHFFQPPQLPAQPLGAPYGQGIAQQGSANGQGTDRTDRTSPNPSGPPQAFSVPFSGQNPWQMSLGQLLGGGGR